MIRHGCAHCNGDLYLIDDAFHTTKCEDCGCRWETRVVLMNKGGNCVSEDEVYDEGQNDEPQSGADRLKSI